MSPKTSKTRASNVYTVNLPLEFKAEILKRAQVFGGASELIGLALDDFALKIKRLRKRLDIVKEFNDYIKLEILLMKKSAIEQQNGQNTKLSFRVKNQLASDTLAYIKQKTGWTTSRAVRVALLWYLFTNYGEIFENENWLSLLKCPHCGFVTHDQRLLNEHILKYHQRICEYCGKPYLISEEHVCPQKLEIEPEILVTTVELPIEEIVKDETLLLEKIKEKASSQFKEQSDAITIDDIISDRANLDEAESKLLELSEEIKNLGGTLVEIPELEENDTSKQKKSIKKTKKGEEDKLDKIQSEISEMLQSLKEDGILD